MLSLTQVNIATRNMTTEEIFCKILDEFTAARKKCQYSSKGKESKIAINQILNLSRYIANDASEVINDQRHRQCLFIFLSCFYCENERAEEKIKREQTTEYSTLAELIKKIFDNVYATSEPDDEDCAEDISPLNEEEIGRIEQDISAYINIPDKKKRRYV